MAKAHSTPQRRATKNKVCETRSLKVRQGNVARTIKDKHHPQFDRTVYAAVPWINLQGQWLEQAGFAVHTPLKVRVMDGCLVVTVEE